MTEPRDPQRGEHREGGEREQGEFVARPDGPMRAPVSRRALLKGAAGAAAAYAAARWSIRGDGLVLPRATDYELASHGSPSFSWSLVRGTDLLNLEFEFYNLERVEGSDGEELVRERSDHPAFIVVLFPAQAIAEQVLEVSQSELDEPCGGVENPRRWRSADAGRSRLAFEVPDDVESIPFDEEHLLDWDPFHHSVVPVALEESTFAFEPPKGEFGEFGSGPSPEIREPRPTETAIELPWRVVLSPSSTAVGWDHAQRPVTRNGRTELWHTRLQLFSGVVVAGTVRAVWSPDYPEGDEDPPESGSHVSPFSARRKTSLNTRERYEIVEQSSNFNRSDLEPRPLETERLMLTPLGGWLDSGVFFDPEAPRELETKAWRHLATIGRDQFVRIVKWGYLFPFGHRASKVIISERKFLKSEAGDMVAYLTRREFLVVGEPLRTFPAPGQPDLGRGLPFRSLRITTKTTPALDPGTADGDYFWPIVDGKPFPFHVVAPDTESQTVDFSVPMLFVMESHARNEEGFVTDHLNARGDDYNAAEAERHRTAGLDGQEIAFANHDPASASPGKTTQETKSLVFEAQVVDDDTGEAPPFYPAMESAAIRVTDASQLSGSDADPRIAYPACYLEHGYDLDGNKGEVYAEAVEPKPLVEFPTDRSGGVGTPNQSIEGLARTVGTFGGDVAEVARGAFKPNNYFEGAKLLGGVLLEEITQEVTNFTSSENEGKKVPKITTDLITPEGETVPTKAEALLEWEPDLTNSDDGIFETTAGTDLRLEAKVVTDLRTEDATYFVRGDLRSFILNLIGRGDNQFLILEIARVRFVTETGSKLKLDVDITNVKFAGALTFVEELKDLLSSTGSGPSLDVDAKGITAGYSLAIPATSVGVFALEDIKLGTAVHIPFGGEAVRVRFNVSERDHPLKVSFSIFGGGAYFLIALGADGMEHLEASIEFGASTSFSFGKVASGGMELMAGLTFAMINIDAPDETLELTGFLRAGGRLSILGLIKASIEFLLSFAYDLTKNIVHGQATLTIKVKVAFVSKTVKLQMERTIGKTEGDPPFGEVVSRDDWEQYADAFAA